MLYDATMQRLRLSLKRKGFENGTVSLIVRCSITDRERASEREREVSNCVSFNDLSTTQSEEG